MIVAVSIAFALAIIAASARRLWLVIAPTAIHPDDLVAALSEGETFETLRSLVARAPEAAWERDLFAALGAPTEEARAALVNEQLTELDYRLQAWARVPRVCASLASSVGLILGVLVLRRGVADDSLDLTGEAGEQIVWGYVVEAITAVLFGLVATLFSIGAHVLARRLTKLHLEATDRMIAELEDAVGAPSAPGSVVEPLAR